MQLIANNPESSAAVRACQKISKIARYAGPDADLAAEALLDTIKQVRDGHYCIAQAEILVASKTKKTILICEDMRDFREAFVKNHKDEYHVISLDRLEYVQPVLSYCRRHRSFPALLVLDLHWPREGTKSTLTAPEKRLETRSKNTKGRLPK